MKIGCVLLAAGNARRFGSNKLQVQVDGESLIRRALETVPSGLVTVVVSQYPEILSLAGEYGFEAVLNDQPDLGLSRSVRLGLERLTDCDGVLFLVADQPWLKRDSAEADLILLETDALELTDIDTPEALKQAGSAG